jgi:pimeloyl-ACP methyl ester carboxylesterase
MAWLTDLNPTLAAAIVSAAVTLLVLLITSLLAPSVKYNFDRRLERRKLELAYVAEQRKALRNHIGYHKGTILAAAEALQSSLDKYHVSPEAPAWLQTRPGEGYFTRLVAFRVLSYWHALERFSREAMFIDATVATKEDWAFVKAVRLNLDVWSDVSLFAGLEYSSSRASAHFFSGAMSNLTEALCDPESERLLSESEFVNIGAEDARRFIVLFSYLSQLRRSRWQLKYQRLVAASLVVAATLNAFGYKHQQTPVHRLRQLSLHCGPEVRVNLRQMILAVGLERARGFRQLETVLGRDGAVAAKEADVKPLKLKIPSVDRKLDARLVEARPAPGARTGGLLFIHGYESDQLGYVPRAEQASRELGLTCLTFDLGDHGASSAKGTRLSRQDHLQDVLAAYDFLHTTEGIDQDGIGVCGASYGAHLACLLVASRPVRRLLLRAPEPPSEEALKDLQMFDGEVLVLEGGADTISTQDVIEKYLNAAQHATCHVIAGATHVLDREEWRAEFMREILAWFKNL